ncbi:MAG: hypothetical protein NTX82_05115 [Candidatus Parcubacteria bacterium]|nr:hypothetical protein [Candidatus Parcubacteria bacterium]
MQQAQPKVCDFDRLKIGLNYARCLGATHAILTGRADPLQEPTEELCNLLQLCREYLPLTDMHTNGLLLHPEFNRGDDLAELKRAGLTMITFSLASFDEQQNYELMHIKKSAADLIKKAVDMELMVRCSLVVNAQGVSDVAGVIDYCRQAGELGAHSVVIREVWVPEIYGQCNQEVYNWNLANKIDIKPIQARFIEICQKKNDFGLCQLDPLPWGTPVFGMAGVFTNQDHGVNITFACCDEGTTGTVIKSIVHKPNGHGYRNWDHGGHILY